MCQFLRYAFLVGLVDYLTIVFLLFKGPPYCLFQGREERREEKESFVFQVDFELTM